MSRIAHRAARYLALAVALPLLVFAPPARSATTGKLQGRVTNEKREPLAGVNIRIEGLRLGTVSGEDGNFFILGVPAGGHVVRANLLGHAPFVAGNVEIRPDFTTTLNIVLRTEAVQLNEVRVEAERPLLQRDATGTTRFLSSEDIQKLPTRGYRDAAANQTGIVNFQRNIDNEAQNAPTLIIRGGRPNETAYFVDGFSQQDPLTGTSSTAISNNAIEEVVVLTGGFNAEYGRIMSGAVNVVTRVGTSRYSGSIEAVSDALAGDWVGAQRRDYNIYDVSLGGPLLPGNENYTFFLSGERRWQRDRQPGFIPDQFATELETGALAEQFGLGPRSLDPDLKPTNSTSGWTYQGKLSLQLNDAMTLRGGGLGSQEVWRQYTNAYLFDLEHAPRYEDRIQNYFGTFNHILRPATFWTLGVNYFETLRKRGDGVHFDRLEQYYRESNPRFNSDIPMFFDPGHVFDDYLQRKSSYVGVQGNWTSQMDQYNQVRIGGDYQRHTLRYFNHYFPVQLGGSNPNVSDLDAYGYDLVLNPNGTYSLVENDDEADGTDGAKHPKTWSLYAQDKFEREGVIVNGGLRYDHINVDTPALRSDLLPLGDPDAAGGSELGDTDLTENKTYARISPRLGVAFPVDDRTQLRFNYGQFYQQPNLQDLYVSYRFLEHKIRTGGYFVGFGNPNLKPERTTAYEVGVARQLGDRVRLDATAYDKDVKDLVQIATIPSFPNAFASYRNKDFATIKGVDVGFAMRPMNGISAAINYSLSYATGTGSVSQTQRNIAWTASQPPKQTAPLDFDQRHKLSMNIDYRIAQGEGPSMGGWRVLEYSGINLLYNVASGTPYTPTFVYNEVTLAAVSSTPSGPLNSRYGPWTSNLDLKATKGFMLAGLNLDASLWVLNVFNTRNPVTVYSSSGTADATNWLSTEDGRDFINNSNAAGLDGEAFYRLAENNPNLYANPRLVRFGLRAHF